MAEREFDVVVIGGGPGGYVAAIRAAQLGMTAACVEKEHLGGICLNWGCIPTKTLLRSAEVHDLMSHSKDFGFTIKGEIEVDFPAVVKRSRTVAGQLSKGVSHLLKKNKVAHIDGQAKLKKPNGANVHTVQVEKNGKSEDIKAKHVILATGARARQLPGLEFDGKLIWSYREAMVPKEMPKSVLVVGSGAIGIEFASFYDAMGADVTVVELLDRILPAEDAEISAFARQAFEKRGLKIHTEAKASVKKKNANSVEVEIAGKDGTKQTVTVDRVISAVGIVGNVENIGIEGSKIQIEKSHVVVDEYMRTGQPGVYAIGDVTGAPWLAHKASHEGVLCVERIAGLHDTHPLDTTKIPGCTYCTPQIASVGYNEDSAKKAGYEIKVGRFPFIGNGKAIALGEPVGLVKTVFDAKTGELLGAHMIGAEVTEMIQGYVLARQMEATELDLMHAVFPHPTLSEMMHESTLDAYGRAIHY